MTEIVDRVRRDLDCAFAIGLFVGVIVGPIGLAVCVSFALHFGADAYLVFEVVPYDR